MIAANKKRLLTINEAANLLGQKSHWGVRNLINCHGLKIVRFGKRGIRIDVFDIDDWIAKHKELVMF